MNRFRQDYCAFTQYYDENGDLITLHDGGIYAFKEDKMENAFAVGPNGKIEDIEVIEDYGCDCTCYEIRLKRNHQKIAYYTIHSGGIWIEDEYALERDCYKALDDILFPFIIEVMKSQLVVPKTIDELFKYIISGCYSKLYYLSGFRKVVNCSANISELEGGFYLEIKNEETKESAFSMRVSLPGSVISQIRKCMSKNRE